MKNNIFTLIGLMVLFLLITPLAFAYNNSINISNNAEGSVSSVNVNTNTGGNIVCVNGKCTTTEESHGKSKVCVNGKCYESDEDLNVSSEDGNTKVNIKSNGSSSVNIQNNSPTVVNQDQLGAKTKELKQEAEKKKEEQLKDADEKAQKALIDAKKEATDKKFDLEEFVNKQLEFLRKIVTFQFLFGSR